MEETSRWSQKIFGRPAEDERGEKALPGEENAAGSSEDAEEKTGPVKPQAGEGEMPVDGGEEAEAPDGGETGAEADPAEEQTASAPVRDEYRCRTPCGGSRSGAR